MAWPPVCSIRVMGISIEVGKDACRLSRLLVAALEGTVRTQVTSVALKAIDRETFASLKFRVYLGAKQLERAPRCALPRPGDDFAGAQ